MKDSVVEFLTLAPGETAHSETLGLRDTRIEEIVCNRPVVKPSNICLLMLRPKMDLSSSGTWSCVREENKRL